MREILFYENKIWRRNFDLVVGIDEAGRGPLAGPVAAAAVAVLDLKMRAGGMELLFGAVKDSKKLSARTRENVYAMLAANKNIIWGSALVSAKIIDKINILEASKKAMAKALLNLAVRRASLLSRRRIFCLIDGNFPINISYPQKSIISGDAKVFSISAASIIAKVERDRYMARLDKKYPDYGFAAHKGYPTRAHLAALTSFGVCPAHRISFAPCALLSKKVIIN